MKTENRLLFMIMCELKKSFFDARSSLRFKAADILDTGYGIISPGKQRKFRSNRIRECVAPTDNDSETHKMQKAKNAYARESAVKANVYSVQSDDAKLYGWQIEILICVVHT